MRPMSVTAEIQAKHAKYVLTPWAVQGGLAAPVIVRGEGRYLFDATATSSSIAAAASSP